MPVNRHIPLRWMISYSERSSHAWQALELSLGYAYLASGPSAFPNILDSSEATGRFPPAAAR